MSDELQVLKLFEQGEDAKVQFIEDCKDYNEIGEAVCALLNSSGGTLLIGVTSRKNVLGVENIDTHIHQLETFLVEKVIPDFRFSVQSMSMKDHSIIVIDVTKGTRGPHIFEGGIYFRNKTDTRKATSLELSAMIHTRQSLEQRWERQSVINIDNSDIDFKLISVVLSASASRSSYKGADALEFLQHFGLYENGHYTHAAVLLFAINPARYIPQIRVRLTEYSSSGKSASHLLRDEIIEDNLFVIRDYFEDYFNTLGNKAVFEDKQWKRTDFRFPIKALQEGIVNGLIHRDYSILSGTMTVKVYPDKIIIHNTGLPPKELPLKDLIKPHNSHPVNPDIAHIFYLMGFIDKLGKGTLKIIEECRNVGLHDPTWRSSENGVKLTFLGPKSLSSRKPIKESLSPDLKAVVSALYINKLPVKSDKVKDRLLSILVYLHVFPESKATELQDYFGVSERTILSDLKAINSYTDYVGSKKYGGYVLIDSVTESITSKM